MIESTQAGRLCYVIRWTSVPLVRERAFDPGVAQVDSGYPRGRSRRHVNQYLISAENVTPWAWKSSWVPVTAGTGAPDVVPNCGDAGT
jgi:hypothetical protein